MDVSITSITWKDTCWSSRGGMVDNCDIFGPPNWIQDLLTGALMCSKTGHEVSYDAVPGGSLAKPGISTPREGGILQGKGATSQDLIKLSAGNTGRYSIIWRQVMNQVTLGLSNLCCYIRRSGLGSFFCTGFFFFISFPFAGKLKRFLGPYTMKKRIWKLTTAGNRCVLCCMSQ